MKANELQIGDFVNLHYRDLVLKVIGVDGSKVFVEAQDNFKLCLSYDKKEIKPIPLTDDVLAANGFEHNGKYYRNVQSPCADNAYWTKGNYKDDGYRIGYHTGKDIANFDQFKLDIFVNSNHPNSSNSINIHNIKYVHELQHILRVFGLNELADNFRLYTAL